MTSRSSSLPVPPLLAALDAWQATGTERERPAVLAALRGVCTALGLRGIALRIEIPPVAELEAAWGTLDAVSAATGREMRNADGTVLGQLKTEPPDGAAADAALDAVSAAVSATWARARAARAEANLSALDAAVRGIAGVLDADRVLQLIVDRVRELVDAQYAALGIINDDGRLERFVTSGLSAGEYRRIGPLPKGRGLLGLIVAENRSFRVADITRDPRRFGFPPHHPPMRSFLGASVATRGRSVGRLYLTNKHGAAEFSEDDQRLVERFALHAAIAIENTRLHDRVQRLAVVEERERIGRDLHDGIIQRIYGVTLALDDVPELIEETSPEAAQRVDRAVDSLNETIGELRTFIFGLGPSLDAEETPRAAIEALVAEVRANTNLRVTVRGDDIGELDPQAAGELLSIAREALSNVARHAGAASVTVALLAEPDQIRLTVVDDGSGFDPDLVLPPEHHGLRNMAQRAERLGGRLRIESRRGGGTRIIVTAPHVAARGGDHE